MKQLYLFLFACLNAAICTAQAGTLDSTFARVGFIRVNNKSFSDGAIQADNKFVVAGSGFPYHSGDLEIYRFTPEGLPDATFGTAGTARATVGGNTGVRKVLIQKDGKILVLGESRVVWNSGTGVIATAPLVRLNTNGQIDDAFGDHGFVKIIFGNAPSVYAGDFSMALQPDGKILVCGPDYTVSDNTFSLWRFNTNGSLDNGLGTNGRVTKAIGNHAFTTRVVVQADGKIVYLGNTTESDGFVARYLVNGMPDPTFNGTGTYLHDARGRYAGAVMQADGKILAAVEIGNNFALERTNANGTPDKTFGVNGLLESQFSLPVYTNSVDLQEDGKILVGGMYAPNPGAYGYGIALARYYPSGILDNTFGTSGLALKYLGYSTGGLVFGLTAKRIYVLGTGADNTNTYMNYGVIAAFKTGEFPSFCGNNKVTICHKGKTLCIASSAVRAHLAHGDRLGSCDQSTPGKPKGRKGDASMLDEEQVGNFAIANAPNPFRNITRIQYEVPADGHVMIKVYNVLGKQIATLVNARLLQGTYVTDFGGESLPNGVYYYHVTFTTDRHNVFTKVGKMVLAK